MLPRVRPATNAAMKPLPPTSSAAAKATPARARTDSRWKGSFIQSARRDRAPTRPPRYPTAAPTTGPSVTCRIAKKSQWARSRPSPVAPAKAIATRTMGRAMPSLRPLSTLRPWRTRTGTSGLLTTACPSAASVGARTAQEHRFPEPEARQDRPRREGSRRDGQGKAEAEQPGRQAPFQTEVREVDASRIGEEHQH